MSETKAPYRVSDLPALTGFSMRYWQRRVAAGHVPGCREVACGKRRVFLIDSDYFTPWWRDQRIGLARVRRKSPLMDLSPANLPKRGEKVVYVLRSGEHAKVGYTSHLRKRVSEIQTGNPMPVMVEAYFTGSLADESNLHQQLRSIGLFKQGEWYAWDHRLVSAVRTYFTEREAV